MRCTRQTKGKSSRSHFMCTLFKWFEWIWIMLGDNRRQWDTPKIHAIYYTQNAELHSIEDYQEWNAPLHLIRGYLHLYLLEFIFLIIFNTKSMRFCWMYGNYNALSSLIVFSYLWNINTNFTGSWNCTHFLLAWMKLKRNLSCESVNEL